MKLATLTVVALLGVGATQAQAGEQSAGTSSSSETADARRVPGARAVRACAAAGAYWPTMTLALTGNAAWVACKEQSRLVRIGLARGRRTASVRLGGPMIAVTAGLGSVWALDSGGTLYRLSPRTARVTRRIRLGATAAYNIWIGGGSVWVADDQAARVLRVSPATNKVVARIGVGSGPADMVFARGRAWVLGHRDNSLFRIEVASNAATRLAVLGDGNAAAERMAMLGGSLWVTGRGLPLLQVDPESGATRRSIDIDGTGIDVVAAAGALWVPVRSLAVDATGFPTMTAVRRVTSAGAVTTAATARGRVDVHGLAAGRGAIWLADNTDGFLYRIAT